jgi:hypothetical protein
MVGVQVNVLQIWLMILFTKSARAGEENYFFGI